MSTPKELQSVSAIDLLHIFASQLKSDNVECTTNGRKDGNAVLKYEKLVLNAVEADDLLSG